jgi:hypothetical protein
VSVDGNWKLVIDSPMGKQNVNVDLTENDGTLAGTMVNTGNNMSTDIFDGTVRGDAVQFKAKLPHLKMTVTFDLALHGPELSGKVKAGRFGGFKVSGERG